MVTELPKFRNESFIQIPPIGIEFQNNALKIRTHSNGIYHLPAPAPGFILSSSSPPSFSALAIFFRVESFWLIVYSVGSGGDDGGIPILSFEEIFFSHP